MNVNEILGGLQEEGDLSAASTAALTGIVDLGQQIQAAMGTPAEQMQASEVTIVTLLVDDSYSIEAAGSAQRIRDGVNLVIKSLKESKQSTGVLMSIRYLNGTLLCPYSPLDSVPELTTKNYQATGGTPLYDESLVTLGGVVVKTAEFANNGVPVRSITCVITDGFDEHSKKSARHVEPLITDMLMTESHIITAMGIGDTPQIQQRFNQTFEQMGFRPNFILTPKNTESEMRKAFAVVNQSAVRVSQTTGANVSQIGGFGV